MPADFWIETAKMLIAGIIVAALLLPVGLLAWRSVQRNSKPLFLPWHPMRAPWGGFEVVFAFLVVFILIPETIAMWLGSTGLFKSIPIQKLPSVEISAAVTGLPAAIGTQEQSETTSNLRYLWSRTIALPLQLTILVAACRIIYPQWWFLARPTLAAQIVVAIVAWVALTPLVLGTNAAVNIVFSILDWQRDTHPLAKLGGRSIQESVLFFFQACIAAPIVEEAIFRGAILGWLIGGRKPSPAPDVPQKLRSWLVVLIALLFTSLSLRDGAIVLSGKEGATIFTLLLILGLVAVNLLFRTKRRTVGGVYSSAALFAVIHSGIWPSPIPLFLLGLGLGWLAVRTRGILVPIIVHGLFNAVSTVFVLMQPAMN